MCDSDKSARREEVKKKLRENFDGRIVRKDLTKNIKEGANVPVYVLEFLLGQYCSSDDEEIITTGVERVKRILADNYVRPDEAEKVLSILRKNGSYTVIDMITVHLNLKKDRYETEFSNLGIKGVPISSEYPEKYDRLLCGGIWCIIQLDYDFIEEDREKQPISIRKVTPIQMPNVNMEELKAGRSQFTKDEWIDVLLRSIGMEPDALTYREKWLLLCRMIPLVENNFNFCELGPRSTGKSHLYKEISPNSILVSGGQTTVANLFYNMSTKTVGLVGMWDVVAFDEVAGINLKDRDGIQIMKDYMAAGSFSRGKEEKAAHASMVFVGNVNHSIPALLATDTLFQPFPDEMGKDTAFLDRLHCYNPGWEIPKFRPFHFTDDYGFISDYLAGFARELRKESFGDATNKWFQLGRELNQRDTIAVRKMVDGLVKLIYPNGEFEKDEIEEVLTFALEMRRRVKDQLRRLDQTGEFKDVNFSYIDKETGGEFYVSVPEENEVKAGAGSGDGGDSDGSDAVDLFEPEKKIPRPIELERDPKYADINSLRRVRAYIVDDELAGKVESLEDNVRKIIDRMAGREDTKDIYEKFMEHYLQITISVLQKYQALQLSDEDQEYKQTVSHDINELLEASNAAANELLSDQIRSDVLDAQTDISALKSQLAMDGLLEEA